MPLPLPQVVSNVGPGGPIVSSMEGINALRKMMLENQYYAPNIQSEINQRNALTNQYNTMTPLKAKEMQISNQYLPDRMRLANELANLTNQYYGPNIQSEMAQRNALTNKYNTMTPLEAKELQLKNQFYPDLTKAQIEGSKALSNIRAMGGIGLGTGGKEELFFQSLVKRDNPNLTPDQAYEAANVLSEGGNQLSDGTPVKLSPISRRSLNRANKSTTTQALITGNIRGEQAEAEIDELSKHAQAALKPYGSTILGYSPKQLLDSFKTDNASQERLGKFIAGKQLQYEIAQNQIKLAAGQPGITSTQELMDLGMQNIKSMYPRLSAKARETAQNYFIEGLRKGFKARKSVDIGASNAYSYKNKATLRYNPQTGDFEDIK